MQTNLQLLSNEQFEKLQLTIIAAQMLPYFFSDAKSYRYNDILLKTPYEKAAVTAKIMVQQIEYIQDIRP